MTDAERAAFEEAARREGYSDFQITEQYAPDQMMRAEPRPEYVPVYYIEPYPGNESALGFDVASDSVRREALGRACDTGAPIASGWIALVQVGVIALASPSTYRSTAAGRRPIRSQSAAEICKAMRLVCSGSMR